MTDEEYIKRTEEPERVRAGKEKPRRLKSTGATFASLKNNIIQKKIDKKINSYNKEYHRLQKLAQAVNVSRDNDLNDKNNYVAVKDNIDAYNLQAARLAKAGAKVLALRDRKSHFKSGNSAKALRVPSFLIGPLKLLSSAGREMKKIEKEMEDERIDAIVSVAKDAVGQKVDDTIDVKKINSLDIGKMIDTVDKIVDHDEPDTTESKSKGEDENIEKILSRIRKEGSEVAKEENEEKSTAPSKNDEKNVKPKEKNPQNKHVPFDKQTLFERVIVADCINVGLMDGKDGEKKEVLYADFDGKRRYIPRTILSRFIDKPGIETDFYKNYIKLVKFAKLWPSDKPKSEETLNFLAESIKNNMSEDEIIAKANEELSKDSAEIITSVIKGNFEVIKEGIEANELLSDPKKMKEQRMSKINDALKRRVNRKSHEKGEETEKTIEATVESSEPVSTSEKVKDKTDSTENSSGSKKPEEKIESAPASEGKNDKVSSKDASSSAKKPGEKVEFTTTPKEKSEEDAVPNLSALTSELSDLANSRKILRDTLGDEARLQIEEINKKIESNLAKISALLKEDDRLSFTRPREDDKPLFSRPLSDDGSAFARPREDDRPLFSRPLSDDGSAFTRPKEDDRPLFSRPLSDDGSAFTRPKEDDRPLFSRPLGDDGSAFARPREDDRPLFSRPLGDDGSASIKSNSGSVLDNSEDQSKRSDLERKEDIKPADEAWWKSMESKLDNPDDFARRSDLDFEHLVEQRRREEARIEEKNKREAREILSLVGMSDESLDAMERSEDEKPIDVLNKMKVEQPDVYTHITEKYKEAKKAKYDAYKNRGDMGASEWFESYNADTGVSEGTYSTEDEPKRLK